MDNRRSSDGSKYKNWFRSSRMMQDCGQWFFHTREGTIEGPFLSEQLAHTGLAIFLASLALDVSSAVSNMAVEKGDLSDMFKVRDLTSR